VQKIILDTNVVISGLLNGKGIPGKILHNIVLEGLVEICISQTIMEEYRDVLSRDKFSKIPGFKTNAGVVLDFIEEFALYFEPSEHITLLRDPDDDYFLDLASTSNADYLITGNTNNFTIKSYGSTTIVTPTDYWNNYRPGL
jgi:putative PIN family toxin of toxin-antitoxin system